MITVDKKLKEKWETILRREGLPKMDEKKGKVQQEKVPLKVDISGLVPEDMSIVFEQFSALPEELQQGIIADIQKQRDLGVLLPEILERTKLLIQKTRELDDADQTDSAKIRRSPIPQESVNNLDDFIKRMEKLSSRRETDSTIH